MQSLISLRVTIDDCNHDEMVKEMVKLHSYRNITKEIFFTRGNWNKKVIDKKLTNKQKTTFVFL